MKQGMIKYSASYTFEEGKTFDLDYYLNKFIPFLKETYGSFLKELYIEKGISGIPMGTPPTYNIVSHLYFETMDDFKNALVPNMDKIVAEAHKFTDIKSVIQISEVIVPLIPST